MVSLFTLISSTLRILVLLFFSFSSSSSFHWTTWKVQVSFFRHRFSVTCSTKWKNFLLETKGIADEKQNEKGERKRNIKKINNKKLTCFSNDTWLSVFGHFICFRGILQILLCDCYVSTEHGKRIGNTIWNMWMHFKDIVWIAFK